MLFVVNLPYWELEENVGAGMENVPWLLSLVFVVALVLSCTELYG